MRKLILSMAVITLAVTACRTSESNYRAAYEQAVAGKEDTKGIDSTIYDKIRREAVETNIVADGDTVPAKRERVKLAEPASGESLCEAYVIAAQFKQLFNARSLCNRLRASGYERATLLMTREPIYYVAVDGGSKADMARACVNFMSQKSVPVKEPYPLVLEVVR